jgi:hypothetical protein
MSGVKDTFDILTDEITLIRREIEQLQRSSLNKDEAKALNEQLVQGVASMAQTGQAVYEAISERMDPNRRDPPRKIRSLHRSGTRKRGTRFPRL